jgi:hypothetical protein
VLILYWLKLRGSEVADLTTIQIQAAANEVLLASGYTAVDVGYEESGARVFEDAVGIVAVHVFETWDGLLAQWHVAQGQLVDLMSAHLRRPEPKTWEGYLVLLTPALRGVDASVAVSQLRSDTHRVRKLVATGEDLTTLDGVRGALLPLIPLGVQAATFAPAGVLELLPELLASSGVDRDLALAVVQAFVANESILGRVHELRTQQ